MTDASRRRISLGDDGEAEEECGGKERPTMRFLGTALEPGRFLNQLLSPGVRTGPRVNAYPCAGLDGCSAMIAIPANATAAPTKSQRVSATPSTQRSQSKATAIYMPP